LEIALGLKAMVKGTMPEAKPAAPMVISEVLPQSGPREHVARRAAQIKGSRFVSLARCEEQAWAELSYAASNEVVWANGRSLKGMPAVSSIQHTGESMEEDPDELGLFGTTEITALDQLASDEEAAWKVEAIKAALSDREWIAIQMKAEGLPDVTIAETLGGSLPTAKKVIRQARAKAKAALV
jgi:DNA-directed RNA polymerase specialized sigma24 family protein